MDGQQPTDTQPQTAASEPTSRTSAEGTTGTAVGTQGQEQEDGEKPSVEEAKLLEPYTQAGVDVATARKLHARSSALHALRDGFAARNPLRKAGRARLMQDARKVAKVGLTGAAFLNPITAPLGLISAANMATRRATWSAAGRALKNTGRFAKDMTAPTIQRVGNSRPVQAARRTTGNLYRAAVLNAPMHPVQWGRSQIQAAGRRIDKAKLEHQASRLHSLNHKYGNGSMSLAVARAQVAAPRTVTAATPVQPSVVESNPTPPPAPRKTPSPTSGLTGEQETKLNEKLAQLDLTGADR